MPASSPTSSSPASPRSAATADEFHPAVSLHHKPLAPSRRKPLPRRPGHTGEAPAWQALAPMATWQVLATASRHTVVRSHQHALGARRVLPAERPPPSLVGLTRTL